MTDPSPASPVPPTDAPSDPSREATAESSLPFDPFPDTRDPIGDLRQLLALPETDPEPGPFDPADPMPTPWFKDEGDAIVLLGEPVDTADPLQGLGGSALARMHLKPLPAPDASPDPEVARTLRTTALGLILTSDIKSLQNCASGGLATTVARASLLRPVTPETPMLGATLDLGTVAPDARLDALLFGESRSRIVITCAPNHATKVVERARLLGVQAVRIGRVGGDRFILVTRDGESASSLGELPAPSVIVTAPSDQTATSP